MKNTKISYIKLFEIDEVNGAECLFEICTFDRHLVIATEVAIAMRATHPDKIYELRDYNEDDEVIGKYRPY